MILCLAMASRSVRNASVRSIHSSGLVCLDIRDVPSLGVHLQRGSVLIAAVLPAAGVTSLYAALMRFVTRLNVARSVAGCVDMISISTTWTRGYAVVAVER
mmetsp:Transcript_10108/g.21842  ORF Transcript_10108/g.21842 Transcript_10108/m.21842 type:complete len:101 (+) Transcript_10108:750-1052(+)